MPTLWMMIGVPGAGKCTWIANQSFDWSKTAIISTDNIIDQRAVEQGKTYSDVFQKEIKSATAEMNSNLQYAIKNNMDIIWDQTNVTAKARAQKLQNIPKTYKKIAVFFATPDRAELTSRLGKRQGKNIPYNIVMSMISQLQSPTYEEGWDEIIKP